MDFYSHIRMPEEHQNSYPNSHGHFYSSQNLVNFMLNKFCYNNFGNTGCSDGKFSSHSLAFFILELQCLDKHIEYL